VSEVTSSQNVISSNNVTGGGVDYNSGQYIITFRAGETSVMFNVSIIDDNILESDEDFTLVIRSRSLLTLGKTNRATVIIADNDGK